MYRPLGVSSNQRRSCSAPTSADALAPVADDHRTFSASRTYYLTVTPKALPPYLLQTLVRNTRHVYKPPSSPRRLENRIVSLCPPLSCVLTRVALSASVGSLRPVSIPPGLLDLIRNSGLLHNG